MKGLSITFVFGKYGGFHIFISSHIFRICLGWFALTIYPRTDIEPLLEVGAHFIVNKKND